MNQNRDNPSNEPNVIYSYTRKQAIKDGELVDISNTSEVNESGFKIPVCVSRNLWAKINKCKDDGQDWKGRLWDVCFLATLAFRSPRKTGDDYHLVKFKVKFYEDSHPSLLWLCFDECDGFTLMFPEDY